METHRPALAVMASSRRRSSSRPSAPAPSARCGGRCGGSAGLCRRSATPSKTTARSSCGGCCADPADCLMQLREQSTICICQSAQHSSASLSPLKAATVPRYAIAEGFLSASTPAERAAAISAALQRLNATNDWLDSERFMRPRLIRAWGHVVSVAAVLIGQSTCNVACPAWSLLVSWMYAEQLA